MKSMKKMRSIKWFAAAAGLALLVFGIAHSRVRVDHQANARILGQDLCSSDAGRAQAAREELAKQIRTARDEDLFWYSYLFESQGPGEPWIPGLAESLKPALIERLSTTKNSSFAETALGNLQRLDLTPDDLDAILRFAPDFDVRVNGPGPYGWCGTGLVFIGSYLERIVNTMGPPAYAVLKGRKVKDPALLIASRHPEALAETIDAIKQNPAGMVGFTQSLRRALFEKPGSRFDPVPENNPTPEIKALRVRYIDLLFDLTAHLPAHPDPDYSWDEPDSARKGVIYTLLETARQDRSIRGRIQVLFETHPQLRSLVHSQQERFLVFIMEARRDDGPGDRP